MPHFHCLIRFSSACLVCLIYEALGFLGIASVFTKGENFFSYNKFWFYCQLSPQGPDLVDSLCSYSTLGMCLNLLRRNYLGHRIKNKYFHKSRVKSPAHIQFCPAPSCDYICNFSFLSGQSVGEEQPQIHSEKTVVFLLFLYTLLSKLVFAFKKRTLLP